MKVVLQRVSRAAVSVSGKVVGEIGPGICLFVGIGPDDTRTEVEAAVRKLAELRIFTDDQGNMNRSLIDVGGEVLVVSQFTLYGDVSRGRRPSFSGAGSPDHAQPLIEMMVDGFRDLGLKVETGEFGSRMTVDLVNDGPVTFAIEVRDGKVL